MPCGRCSAAGASGSLTSAARPPIRHSHRAAPPQQQPESTACPPIRHSHRAAAAGAAQDVSLPGLTQARLPQVAFIVPAVGSTGMDAAVHGSLHHVVLQAGRPPPASSTHHSTRPAPRCTFSNLLPKQTHARLTFLSPCRALRRTGSSPRPPLRPPPAAPASAVKLLV